MKLPKSTDDWHEGHLEQAIRERDAAFAKYERAFDATDPDASSDLFMAYLRKDECVDNLLRVVRGQTIWS